MLRTRWVAPILIGLAGFSAFGLAPVVSASAAPTLPPITPQALIAKAGNSQVSALSGTVSAVGDLGLPQLPAGDLGGSSGSGLSSLTSLLSGTNTLRVWANGARQARLAWVQPTAEQDIVRNGSTLWTYSSKTDTATRATLPTAPVSGDPAAGWTGYAPLSSGSTSPTPLTPQQMAAQFLAAITPTTGVSVPGTASVAGHSAYLLQLVPNVTGSLVHSVQLAIDSSTGLPLRVQVFAVGQHSPAVSVGYSRLALGAQSPSLFDFTPPAGATVHQLTSPTTGSGTPAPGATGTQPTVTGSGWNSIMTVPGVALGTQATMFDRISHPVSGGGRVITTSLLSVYLAPNGTLYAGAVTPGVLQAAAGQ